MDLTNNEAMTPEAARAAIAKIAELRKLKEKQLELLAELEAAIANKVGEKVWFDARSTRAKAPPVRCTRCGRGLGFEGGEYAIVFDGRHWHVGNCLKR